MAIELSVGDKGAAAAQSGGGPHRVRPRARRIGWGDFRATAAALTAFAAIGIAIALCQTALAQATALLIAFAAAAAGLALGFLLGLPAGRTRLAREPQRRRNASGDDRRLADQGTGGRRPGATAKHSRRAA